MLAEALPVTGGSIPGGKAHARRTIERIVIINDFALAQGGATIVALQAARQFRRMGYAVTFICGGASSEELSDIGVQQVALGGSPLLELPRGEALVRGLYNGDARRLVEAWIARNDTPGTLYHLHNWSQIISPSVFDALHRVEPRLLVTCHDFFNICPNGGFVHFAGSRECNLRPLSPQCLVSQCDRRSSIQKYWRSIRHAKLNAAARFRESRATFTFLHERMERKFVDSGFGARDRVVLPNPVTAWSRDRISAERNDGFLFVGRIGRDKGADLAIAAAKEAGQKITLVGTGELAAGVAHSDPDVRFAGWLDATGIARLAREARALLVPTRVVEPFGLVLLEAAMSGLPVVVSSHSFLASDLISIGAGVAVQIDQDGEMTGVLARMARDDAGIAQMSNSGFGEAHRLCHSPENWAREILQIMHRKLCV